MIRRTLGLALAVLVLFGPCARATVPCGTYIEGCEEKFVGQNLPLLHKPDLKDPRRLQIQASIIEARDLERRETALKEDINGGDPVAAASAAKELPIVRGAKYAARNKAIAQTIMIYELTPRFVNPIDNSDSSRPMGIKSWSPHYSECENLDIKTDHCTPQTPEERLAFPIGGGTSKADAHVVIMAGAFTSPDAIAALIYHETVHWLIFNAFGRQLSPHERFNSEVLAYQKEIDAKDVFNLQAADVSNLSRIQARYQLQAHLAVNMSEKEVERQKGWLPASVIDTPSEPRPGQSESSEDIDDIVSRAIRQTHARVGRQRDGLLRESLRDIALMVCSGGELTQGILDDLPRASGNNFADGRTPDGIEDECSRDVYTYLLLQIDGGDRPLVKNVLGAVPKTPAPAQLPLGDPSREPHAAPADTQWQARALARIAAKACDAPGDLTKEDIATAGGLILDVPDAEAVGRRLAGCASSVFNQVVRAIRGHQVAGGLSVEYVRGLVPSRSAPMPPAPIPSSAPARQAPRRERDDSPTSVDHCRRFYGNLCNG